MNHISSTVKTLLQKVTPDKQPLRILHILDHSIPIHSGYSFRTLAILRKQRELGWETFQLTSPKQGKVVDTKEQVDGWCFYRTSPARKLFSEVPIFKYWRLMQALEIRLREVVNTVHPHIIHAHSPVLNAIPALAVGQDTGLPVVYEIRAFWEDAAADHGTAWEGGPRYRLTRKIETHTVRRAQAVTTICEGLRADLIARGIPAEKITVIPNGVDVERFRFKAPADPELIHRYALTVGMTLGFAGSFYSYEGLDLLLRALPAVVRVFPQARLLLIGGGPQEQKLRELAAELELQQYVYFVGPIPHTDVTRYYSVMDVMVYPRIPRRLTELVTPLKPLEAMALGKLVVASDVGGHREMINDQQTGYLFQAGSAQSLAERLIQVLRSRHQWDSMLDAGRSYVERQRNWMTIAEGYRQVYAYVLASGVVRQREIYCEL